MEPDIYAFIILYVHRNLFSQVHRMAVIRLRVLKVRAYNIVILACGNTLRSDDGVLVFSVGGGNREKNVSVNLVRAVELARSVGAKVFGIVGRDGGYTKQQADACVVVPTITPERVTPHTEGFAAVVWHLLVSHPKLQRTATKWESVT